MWDSWLLKSQNHSAFEPTLLSSPLYLSPTAAISTVPSHLSQQDAFYQVAANVVLAAGWPISISFSSDCADCSYPLSNTKEQDKHLHISLSSLYPPH